MAGQDEDTEKHHEPTQKKLTDARKRGEVPKSVDLITASTYMGVLALFLIPGASGLLTSASVLASIIDRADTISGDWFSGSAAPFASQLLFKAALPLSTWLILPALLAFAAILAQRAFVVAPEKIQPKASRISPLSNLKNKFGVSGLFEFFKSFLKLLIYSGVLGAFLYIKLEEIVALTNFDAHQIVSSLARFGAQFMAIVLVVALSLGTIDFLFQHHNHLRKNRMSRKEMTDEAKEAEGDPHVKQARRKRAYEIATSRMMEDVPKADVVVVNPTHYAVALKWARTAGSAPECVAKGVDEIAARIREIAAENAIPIHSDPPTARALYAAVDVGDQIQPDHYEAVAAAIRFADMMREKAKKGW